MGMRRRFKAKSSLVKLHQRIEKKTVRDQQREEFKVLQSVIAKAEANNATHPKKD